MENRIITVAILLLLSLPCRADVLETAAGGFSVSTTISTHAAPAESWSAMVGRVSEWWHSDHTWSGSAENLYIDAKLGGCFCERLPQDGEGNDGGVEHLRIVYLKPLHEIRFDGALGPLQTMAVQGRMTWKINATETGSTITFTYLVHGYLDGGFAGMAPAVDSVIKQQLDRLGKLLETG